MSAQLLSAIAGVVLSLIFSYVPRVKDWFGSLDPTEKRLVMLVLLVVVTAAIFGLSCVPSIPLGVPITCDVKGIVTLIEALLAAVVANQSVFLISPKPAKAKG